MCFVAASLGEPLVSEGKKIDTAHSILKEQDSEINLLPSELPKDGTSHAVELPKELPIELPQDESPEASELPKELTFTPSEHKDTPSPRKGKKKTKKVSSANASPA